MSSRPVNEYAYAHARIRGRIGNMPDEAVWQRIVNAGDLETTIESMSGSGLQYWVTDFPRHPEPLEIERRCLLSLMGICLFVSTHLSERWKATGQWLLELPHVLQVSAALSIDADKKQLLPASPFLALMALPAVERGKMLREGAYAFYLDEALSPESRWMARFESSLPKLNSQERHTISRLSKLLLEHHRRIEPDMTPDQVWIERSALFDRLKALLAGNPFHIGTLLIYAILESIQFERVRAILLLRAYKWPTSLLGGLV